MTDEVINMDEIYNCQECDSDYPRKKAPWTLVAQGKMAHFTTLCRNCHERLRKAERSTND